MTPSELIELGSIDPASLTINIAHDPPPAATPDVVKRWDTMRAEKPRLFNGPVLSYIAYHDGVVTARRDTYQRLAVQEHEPTSIVPPVMQLSVTGIITALNDHGSRHVLVGRRSHATRIYGGMWELGPSGGVDPPPPSETSLDGLDVFRQLTIEMREETGLTADPTPGPIIAITIDPVATSADLVMRIDLPQTVNEITAHTEHGWEYEATRWIACLDFIRFVDEASCIPPTQVLAELVQSLG